MALQPFSKFMWVWNYFLRVYSLKLKTSWIWLNTQYKLKHCIVTERGNGEVDVIALELPV